MRDTFMSSETVTSHGSSPPLTGAALDSWIHRWVNKYRDLPYCLVNPQPTLQ